jgi:hypothetical protein
MLRYFRSGVPEPKIPQRFFAGMGSNKTTSIGAKRLKTYFFPEGRFTIFAGSRSGAYAST